MWKITKAMPISPVTAMMIFFPIVDRYRLTNQVIVLGRSG